MKAPVCKLCRVEHWGYQPHRWAQKQVVMAKGRPVAVKRKLGQKDRLPGDWLSSAADFPEKVKR
jgi:hypothetical protein